MRDTLVAVPISDDLALLRDLDTAAQRLGRLRKNGAVRGSAAASDAAAAAMKQFQRDIVLDAGAGQDALRVIEIPVRRQIAAVFAAVAVADHDLLAQGAFAGARRQVFAIGIVGEEPRHDLGRAIQVVDGLEKRHDVDILVDADFAGEKQHRQHIAGLGRHAGDDGVDDDRVIESVRLADHLPGADNALRRLVEDTDIDREERPAIVDLPRQQRLLLVFRAGREMCP